MTSSCVCAVRTGCCAWSVTCSLDPRPSSQARRFRESDVRVHRCGRWPRSRSRSRVSMWACRVPGITRGVPAVRPDAADGRRRRADRDDPDGPCRLAGDLRRAAGHRGAAPWARAAGQPQACRPPGGLCRPSGAHQTQSVAACEVRHCDVRGRPRGTLIPTWRTGPALGRRRHPASHAGAGSIARS